MQKCFSWSAKLPARSVILVLNLSLRHVLSPLCLSWMKRDTDQLMVFHCVTVPQEEDCELANIDANNAGLKTLQKSAFRTFYEEENEFHAFASHNEFRWVTLNANITFVVYQEPPQGPFNAEPLHRSPDMMRKSCRLWGSSSISGS